MSQGNRVVISRHGSAGNDHVSIANRAHFLDVMTLADRVEGREDLVENSHRLAGVEPR